MCPHCGRDAPIVYRGALPLCTACGGLRPPLTSPSVNLAGKPSKVGGAIASVAGWAALLVGLSTSLGLALILYALVSATVALAVALPVAMTALVLGVVLVRSGHALRRSGFDAERATREQALLAHAAERGPVTAADAARLLGIAVADADAILTALAKREPERMAVDIDDQGVVRYRSAGPPGEGGARVRLGEEMAAGAPRPVRIGDDVAAGGVPEDVEIEAPHPGAVLRR